MSLGKLIKRLPEKPNAKLFTKTSHFLELYVIISLSIFPSTNYDYYSEERIIVFWVNGTYIYINE